MYSSIIDARAIVDALKASGDDDEQLIADMVEGETDFYQFTERLLSKIRDAQTMQKALAERAKDIAERKAAFVAREERYRTAILEAMNLSGIPKITLPEATISKIAVKPSVLIQEESLLPDSCVRIKREPDKAAIKAMLDAGETIEGAIMSNGGETLMIRTK